MQKILTRTEREKKGRINQILIGVVLIGLMFFSVLGYALSGKDEESLEKIEYKGIEFVQDNSGYWNFQANNQDFLTKYNPEETKNILFNSFVNINAYPGKVLYFDSKFQEPNYEIARNLEEFVLRIQNACLSEDNCDLNYPVKDCSVDNMIIIKEINDGEQENIYQEDNCVFITASLGNQTKYADAFLFKILGI